MSFRDANFQDESNNQPCQNKEFHPIRDLIDNIRANRERRHEARLARRQDCSPCDNDFASVNNPRDRRKSADRIGANEYPRNASPYENYPPRRNEPPQYYPARPGEPARLNPADSIPKPMPAPTAESMPLNTNPYDAPRRRMPSSSTEQNEAAPLVMPPVRFSTVEPPLAEAKKSETNFQGNGAVEEPARLPADIENRCEPLDANPKVEPTAETEPVADEARITERAVSEPIYVTERNGDKMSIADNNSVSADDRLGVYLRERGNLLTELDVNGSAISDKSLGFLSQAPNLSKLALNDTSVNDDSMSVLAKQGLKNLQELNLHSTRVGDSGVAQLKDMPIKKLNLSDTVVSDDCLKQLKTMRSLQVLTFDYSDIRNEGVKAFKDMPGLRSLSLKGCPISDDSVGDLAKCQQLMLLNLEDTKLSADKVSWLQKHMPRCVIVPPDGTGTASEGHKHRTHPQERPGLFKLPIFRRDR